MFNRRALLSAGIVAPLGSALAGAADRHTAQIITGCANFAGMSFTPAQQTQMLAAVDEQIERLRRLRAATLENELSPAEVFDPRLPSWQPRPLPAAVAPARVAPDLPAAAEDIAFAPAWQQAAWIASGRLRARELTEIYLARIEQRAARLEAIVTLTAAQARCEADALDREQAAGHLRGPLHGLPYGLKDLIDTAGVPTTWGAEPFAHRVPEKDAVVVQRLRAAGAILLAKTSCGALAYGDIWHGGRTRNPWNIEEGSSGSSAGSAALVADGLCSFAIGTETMGSIVAPAARCGAVGLRATYGRVPRTGTMALCWSYDKMGVIARAVDDTFDVLSVMQGVDHVDPGGIQMPLAPMPAMEPANITLGYRPQWFEQALPHDRAALQAARELGFRLVEIDMPDLAVDLLGGLVVTEAAANFEFLTLTGLDRQLRWQDAMAWPNTWRAARFEPAIGHIQAQRLRRRLMQQFAQSMAGVDAVLHPNDAADLLAIGNHCGYPALVIPSGLAAQPTRPGFTAHLASQAGQRLHTVPFATSLTGHLFDEPRLAAIGRLIERSIKPGQLRPPLVLPEKVSA